MTSDQRLAQSASLIDALLEQRLNQERMDEIYAQFVNMYHEEMGLFMKEISTTKNSKKAIRWTRRPYWDNDLSLSWQEFHRAEKAYLHATRRHKDFDTLKRNFLVKQKAFDKMLKKKKRSFERSEVYSLEKANINDPVAFWRHITSLGPRSSNKIPMEVYDEEGNVVTDTEAVLDRWKGDFEGLLQAPADRTPEQCQFEKDIIQSNRSREALFNDGNCNQTINADFTVDEVKKIVQKAKNGKAPGVDGLIADIFKNVKSIELLTEVFNACLVNNIVPTDWTRGIINPIPKSGQCDPRVPLNYRGISLLSVAGKLFTASISSRISLYLESNNMLANEQNGFRAERSCLDHIFSL